MPVTNGNGNMMERAAAQQNIVLQNRRNLTLTGAEDVLSFDETSIVIRTALGVLSIEGSELHILKLNTDNGEGSIIIEGALNGLFYIDEQEGSAKRQGGLFGRRQK